MAAEEEPSNVQLEMRESIKKLEHEKEAALRLNESLRAEVKRLSKENFELKQEKAPPPSSNNTSTIISDAAEPDWVANGGYERIHQCCLYYHSQSGYYYEAITQLFLSPVTTDQPSTDNNIAETKSDAQSTSAVAMSGDIASQLAAVSDKASHQCGFVYDEKSGLYYDHNTGWYYDQANQLYYDAENGTYYIYDYTTKQYQIHSHVELPSKEYDPSEDICTIVSNKATTLNDRVVEEEKLTELDKMFEDDFEETFKPKRMRESTRGSPPPMSEWPPCIRLIPQNKDGVKKSELAGSQDARNCISLITAEGASIGREVTGPQSLRIVDIQVSKLHCEIVYLKRRELYALKDCGSQNGTYINESRLSQPKEKSKLYFLQHGDHLKIGSTEFLLHIHRGMACCTDCSQLGITVVGNDSSIDESLEVQRRKGLNKLKKKYGLRMKDSFDDKLYQLPQNYTDKAEERRRKFGSDLPDTAVRDDSPSSVNIPIESTNKGHQMLLKIGWREGESLGANNTGLQEPVGVAIRNEKSGLGYTQSVRNVNSSSSTVNYQKMMQRYKEMDRKKQL